jgi:hypothetical protein
MELSSLKPLFDRPGPWASVYVDTSRETEDARQLSRLRTRAVGGRLEEQGADPRTIQALLDALARLPVSGAPPGRALFAAGGEVVVDQPLAHPPPAVDTCWSALPHLAPLVTLAGDEPALLVAHLDRKGARFELWRLLEREDKGEVRGEEHLLHRAKRADWSSKHSDYKIEDRWEHNAGLVAEELERLCGRTDVDLIVLAGGTRERRYVHDRLPARLADIALETGPEPREVDLARAHDRWQRARIEAALDRFQSGRRQPGGDRHEGSGPGPAAEGVPAVLDAARRHQIDTLLVRPDALQGGREVWIGPLPDHVAVRRREVEAMGVEAPRAARADDALLRAAAATDARVLVLPEGTVAPAGGVGAVLRWSDESR